MRTLDKIVKFGKRIAAAGLIGVFLAGCPNPVPVPTPQTEEDSDLPSLYVSATEGPNPLQVNIKLTDEEKGIKEYYIYIDKEDYYGPIDETIKQETPIDITRTFIGTGKIKITGICTDANDKEKSAEPVEINVAAADYPEANTKIFFTEYNYNESYWDAKNPGADDSGKDLWSINSDGTGLKKISDNVESRIKVSPDGEYIAFKSGGGMHKISDLEGNILYEFRGGNRSDEDFNWTPDGNSVLFGIYCDGIYRYDMADNTIHQIVDTKGFTYDHNPAMSPNLEKIVYAHTEYENKYTIYLINADGTGKESLANDVSIAYDEQLELTWVNDKDIIWKAQSGSIGQSKLYYLNLDEKKEKEIDVESVTHFPGCSKLQLSSDKKSLAAVISRGAIFFDMSAFPDVKVGEKLDDLGNNLELSSSGSYFAVSDSNWEENYVRSDLKIFNRDLVEYKLLNRKDFPETGWYKVEDIAWSSKTLP